MKGKAKPRRRRKKPIQPELKNKIGHPLAYPDVQQAMKLLEGLGAIMATHEEAAAVLRVSKPTLYAMFARWPEVKEAFETGRMHGRVSLRRNQVDLSKRNATMAIFLGMNWLGQKDLRNVNHAGTVEHQHLVMHTLLKEIDAESRDKPLIDASPDDYDETVAGPDDEEEAA